MSQILKINFQGTLRRVSVPIQQDKPNAGLALTDLEAKARDLFSIPSFAQLQITYMDEEDDVVTIANDDDYQDACIVQALNPLKLEVQVVGCTELVGYKIPSHSPMSETNKKNFLMRLWPSRLVPQCKPWFLDLVALDKFCLKSWLVFARPKASLPVVVHQGVQCDYCGMTPIQGPRYTSTNTPDYDLCAICFRDIAGDERFYTKIDVPAMTHLLEAGKDRKSVGNSEENIGGKQDLPLGCKLLQTPNHHRSIAPGSQVLQVWHMQNVGSLPWPQGTKLVPLRSSTLSNGIHVDLELPEGGLSCGEELHVCVAITAPNEGGRYAGTWSLITPSGITFGERPHMVIQVLNQREHKIPVKHHQLSEQHGHKPKAGRSEILNEHTTTRIVKRSLNDIPLLPSHHVNAIATNRDPELNKEFQLERDNASTPKKIDTNLENTVDWDWMREELQLMGFEDKLLNECLLLKHNGSIKKAVKELIDKENGSKDKI